MAASELNYVFTYYSTSRIDGDKIFLDEESNDNTEKSIWLLVNAEFKLAVFEINWNNMN